MKLPIFKKIQNFFNAEWLYIVLHFRRFIKMRAVERNLKQAVANQQVDRIIYKDIINKDMFKALRIAANSKFIPDDIKNKEEIKLMVMARHGDQMNLLNIKITDDLKLI